MKIKEIEITVVAHQRVDLSVMVWACPRKSRSLTDCRKMDFSFLRGAPERKNNFSRVLMTSTWTKMLSLVGAKVKKSSPSRKLLVSAVRLAAIPSIILRVVLPAKEIFASKRTDIYIFSSSAGLMRPFLCLYTASAYIGRYPKGPSVSSYAFYTLSSSSLLVVNERGVVKITA